MKKLLILLLSALSLTVFAQQKKVAVLEPIVEDGDISVIYTSVLRSNLMSSISNEMAGYQAFTRSDVDVILREQNFQQSGVVDDATRKRLGSLGGVDYICVSKMAEGHGYLNIDILLVDVQSGKIENSANKLISSNDIEVLKNSAIELGKKIVGLDKIERQQAEAERQKALAEQRERDLEEQRKQEELAKQQQLEDSFDELGNSIVGIVNMAAQVKHDRNSYYIHFVNLRSSPRRLSINGQVIGTVEGYSEKTFTVPIQMQGVLKSVQTRDYIFSPNVETFTISGVRARQTINVKNK